MLVRRSTSADLAEMLRIYEVARRFMAAHGNAGQWVNGYPSRDLLADDIAKGQSYIVEADGRVVGTFCFVIGSDPTYKEIEGRWLDDAPYGTIHRIASSGAVKGVADACLKFCRGLIRHIRIDTHADNSPMQNWILKNGFTYCGVIHVEDGTPRQAYELG